MSETPKEGIYEQKNARKDQNNANSQKQVCPQSQQIIEQFVKINGEKCSKIYKKLSFLGKGGFAQCYLTQQKDTNRKSATKIIPKKLLDSHRTKIRLANQIKLHKSLRHENIVQFYSTFEDENNVYIGLQVCEHGSINDLLRARFCFKTPEVQSFLYGICQGVKYLHSRNIIHRDLKLGNIFLGGDLKVKVGDFGLACKLEFQKQYKRTVCGTPNYIAPEILEGKGYHFSVDIWAIGVIIYTLYYTIPPFETQQPHTTYQKIRKCQYEFPKYPEAPPEAIDLIKRLLTSNPLSRPTIDQILDSPFMKLGGSIPLGLPSLILNRPPTKKDLANWPKLVTAEQQNQNKQMNGTVLGFFGLTKNICNQKQQFHTRKPSLIKKIKENEGQPDEGLIFCRTAQQPQNQVVVFYLNNGNFGVFDIQKSVAFTCKLKQKSQKISDLVNKTSLNQSGSIISQQVQLPETTHKVLINLKHKQLVQNKAQLLVPKYLDKQTTVSKMNIYKDVTLIRLTNRTLQILYKENDGFVLTPSRKTLFYFYSFAENQKGKEIDFGAIFDEKQNKANSNHFSITSFFKSKRNQKNCLTMKKIGHLKSLLTETVYRNAKKTY